MDNKVAKYTFLGAIGTGLITGTVTLFVHFDTKKEDENLNSQKLASAFDRTKEQADKLGSKIILPPKKISINPPRKTNTVIEEKHAGRIKEHASSIAKEAIEGLKWTTNTSGRNAANSLIEEYNGLVREAMALLGKDAYIQLLEQIEEEETPEVAASIVGRLTREIEFYLDSHDASRALKQTANAINIRAIEGLKWTTNTSGRNAANSLVWEYNYLVRRTKTLYEYDRSAQLLEEKATEKTPNVAAGKIGRLSKNLERILQTF